MQYCIPLIAVIIIISYNQSEYRIELKRIQITKLKTFFLRSRDSKKEQQKEKKIKTKNAIIAVVLKTRPQYLVSLNSIFLSGFIHSAEIQGDMWDSGRSNKKKRGRASTAQKPTDKKRWTSLIISKSRKHKIIIQKPKEKGEKKKKIDCKCSNPE